MIAATPSPDIFDMETQAVAFDSPRHASDGGCGLTLYCNFRSLKLIFWSESVKTVLVIRVTVYFPTLKVLEEFSRLLQDFLFQAILGGNRQPP